MGLITWPTLIGTDLLNDKDIDDKLVSLYSNFPLSIHELWQWYQRYIDSQREFARAYPDIILIDAAKIFGEKDKIERLRLF
jgi:hypothetical protein